MFIRLPLAVLGMWLCSGALTAAPTAPTPMPARDTKELSAILRKLMLANLPEPLVEANMGWDIQREVAIGVKWEKHGLLRKPVIMRDVKNDGHWQKVHIHAKDPDKSFALAVSNIRASEPGHTLFDADIGLDTNIVYEQQMWAGGKRLQAGESRARCRAELHCVVELTDKIDFKPGSRLPVLSFRIRVVEANLKYKDLVCEHTLGVGGEAAALFGKTMLAVLKTVHPNTEKDLLAKANAAIVKAADTKEVRVELDKLFQPKPAAPGK